MTTKTTIREIALAKLIPSKSNVRRTGRDIGIEELAASIKAHGLLQSLSVRPLLDALDKPTGKYAVSGGNRRLAALKLLAKRKQIAKTYAVPCIINSGNEEELSLAENVMRENLHPADQFDAFRKLADDHGMGIEDIAARFGVAPQVVRQRLRLAAVSPKLMQRYRDGELNLDQIVAFAVTEDHARQEEVHDNLGWNKEPQFIRRTLMAAHVTAADRRAVFVGAENYEAAGGVIVRDLFADDSGGGYFADAALLDRLTLLKLGVIAGEITEREGWKWALSSIDFPHAHGMRREFPQTVELPAEDKARRDALASDHDALGEEYGDAEELPDEVAAKLDAIQSELDAFSQRQYAYTEEVTARAGVFVSLAHDGSVRIDRGFVRPEDQQLRNNENPDAAEGAASSGSEGEKTGAPLSDALIRDLTAHRTLGLRLALGGNPDVAFIAVTHALASQLFYPGYERVSCLEIRATETPLGHLAQGIDDMAAAKTLNERHEAWGIELPQHASELWDFISTLEQERRLCLFAHCAALTVHAVQLPNDRRYPAVADTLAPAVALDMSATWQPTAQSYFSRVSKAQIVEAVREAVSEDAARDIAGLKKQAMAEVAEQRIAGAGWLPTLLRTPKADNPNEAEALAVAAE